MDGMLLAVDTAGSRCSVAVMDGARTLLARREPDLGRGHAELLMGLLAAVLSEAGAGYRDIGKLAVATGPGSFTGLRVGVAAVRGLALALDIPAVGVTVLEALAEPCGTRAPVLAALDAKRGEVYAALFGEGGAVLREPAAVAVDDLPAFLDGAPRPAAITGSAARIVADRLAFDAALIRPGDHPAIAAVARIGLRREPGDAPRPLYLRGADAKPQGGRQRVARLPAAGAVPPVLP